jgi:hypothetical protein
MPRIGLGLGLGQAVASAGGGFDADAQAFFDRVTTAGGTLTTTEKNATNQLVLDMKSAGIWSSMKAVYPMVGASAAACAQNLKSSSFTGTFSSGWTFASTGATPNGSSAYMGTGLNVNTLSTSGISLGYYSRTNTLTNPGHLIDASLTGIERFGIALYTGTFYTYLSNNAAFGNVVQANSLGFYQGYRNNTLNVQAYKNSTKILSNSAEAITTLINKDFEVARGGVSVVDYAIEECAFAYIGLGLTDTEASDFYTLVQTFQTTLSRQV